MEYNELVVSIAEEVINEVSAGYVKKKAEAVLQDRKAKNEHANKFSEKVYNHFDKDFDNPHVEKAREESGKQNARYYHAKELANSLPDTKKSIKPMVKSANKVATDRIEHHWNDVEPKGTQDEISKSYDRAKKAAALVRTTKKDFARGEI